MIDAKLNTVEDLEALPVKIAYVGEVTSKWGEGANMVDQWRVVMSNGKESHSFDYFTGLGHRVRRYTPAGKIYDSRTKKYYLEEVVAPKIASVLYSLVSDARAEDENFNEWCGNYGYSNDSIKALNIYLACLETGESLRKVFSRETLEQIRELLQGY